MKANHAGFTLIELVIVIVILGILAATAVPKFSNLAADARASVMQAVEGSMRSANIIIYARAATDRVEGKQNASIQLNGQTINTVYGYAASMADLRKAMELSPSSDFVTVNQRIDHVGADTQGGLCSVSYTKAVRIAAAGGNPAYIKEPIYTLNVTECA